MILFLIYGSAKYNTGLFKKKNFHNKNKIIMTFININ